MSTDGASHRRGGSFWLAALPALVIAIGFSASASAQPGSVALAAAENESTAAGPSSSAAEPGPPASPSPASVVSSPGSLNSPAPVAGASGNATPAASPSSASSAVRAVRAPAATDDGTSGTTAGEANNVAGPAASKGEAGNATPAPSPESPSAANAPLPPGTQVIPPIVPDAETSPTESAAPSPGNDISTYQNSQHPSVYGNPGSYANPGSLNEFLAEGEVTSPIGLRLRETRRTLSTGEEAYGLLIVDVTAGSPAADAGLRPFHRAAHAVLTGAAIAAALVFPPAIMILPVIDYTEIGESYDMIIGVDGDRITNFLDFEQHMHDVRPGEIVYLSVVRNGKRVQIPVPIPPSVSSASH
jgi:PDZ domain-containing protein